MALTLVIQTTLTFLIGGTVIFEDVWQRRVAPLAASAAGCQWLRRLLAATSTVEVAAGALSRESRFCAAGSPPWQPQPLGLAAEVRPPTPAASLVAARRGSPCCRGCGAFLAGLFAWSIAIPDPIHCRSLTDVSAGTRARARVPLWSAIGGLIVRGLFWSPFLFIVFWPLWVGISAAIWGVDDYNNFPQPELIMVSGDGCPCRRRALPRARTAPTLTTSLRLLPPMRALADRLWLCARRRHDAAAGHVHPLSQRALQHGAAIVSALRD